MVAVMPMLIRISVAKGANYITLKRCYFIFVQSEILMLERFYQRGVCFVATVLMRLRY